MKKFNRKIYNLSIIIAYFSADVKPKKQKTFCEQHNPNSTSAKSRGCRGTSALPGGLGASSPQRNPARYTPSANTQQMCRVQGTRSLLGQGQRPCRGAGATPPRGLQPRPIGQPKVGRPPHITPP
jgi:hypothetical protein